MKVRRRKYKVSEKREGYWPSFVDAMTAIALVFFFIMMTTIGMTSTFSDDIAKNRLEIYKIIEEALKENGVSEDVMAFDREKGKIEVYSETTFERDSAKIKPEGAYLASQLNDVFLTLFTSTNGERIVESIDYIEILGHTDFAGTTAHGRNLSTARAAEFLNTMIPIGGELEMEFGNKFKASGMSEFESYDGVDFKDVINKGQDEYVENAQENKKARRIEIRIIFNEIELNSIMEGKSEV